MASTLEIQIWAPGIDASSLVAALVQARLRVSSLAALKAASPDLPLLVGYADPLGRLSAPSPHSPLEDDAALLAALPQLDQTLGRWRLVNLSCVVVPAIVAWLVDASANTPPECSADFVVSDPFDALLAIAWLQAHPERLQDYRQLESHPLAAHLDRRPPDLDCLQRYQQAASLEALLLARQERNALDADLARLVAQLEPLQALQLESLALREQLGLQQAQIQEADGLKARCGELQLSLEAQQLDLEQLAQRLALLERLVSVGNDASLCLQGRLAQVLA